MGAFQSTRTFFQSIPDLTPVVEDLTRHFQNQQFEIRSEKRITGDWDVSLANGNIFKTVCGQRTALKIELRHENGCIFSKAGIGIFGQQTIPTVISMLLFWPVLVPRIWGLVAQSKLDDEALTLIGESLARHGATVATPPTVSSASEVKGSFCTICGVAFRLGRAFALYVGQSREAFEGIEEEGIQWHTMCS